MNYYYDIILNWNEEEIYNFFEWNDTDSLELIKRIPLIKVKHKTFLDFIDSKVKVETSFLDSIYNKTLISSKKEMKKLEYAALFTDGKSVIAIEFNKEGISLNYSVLLIDDELNTLESLYNIKETEISYEILTKLKRNKELRQVRDAKRLIALEVSNLYQNKEIAKLKYLFYEYKKEKSDDIKIIYETLMNDLKKNLSKEILNLYDIIKLSYHNV